jgi:hypothetical protein
LVSFGESAVSGVIEKDVFHRLSGEKNVHSLVNVRRRAGIVKKIEYLRRL